MYDLRVSRLDARVRQNLFALAEEGLLKSEQGRGTFVCSPLMARPSTTRLLSFAESMDEQDIPYTTTVIEQKLKPASVECAHALGLEPACDHLFLARVRSVGGHPVMFIESHLNLSACPGLEEADFTQEGVFAAVERTSGRAVGDSSMRTKGAETTDD